VVHHRIIARRNEPVIPVSVLLDEQEKAKQPPAHMHNISSRARRTALVHVQRVPDKHALEAWKICLSALSAASQGPEHKRLLERPVELDHLFVLDLSSELPAGTNLNVT
jgi:hypothetical protein